MLKVKDWMFPYLYFFFPPNSSPAEGRKRDALQGNTDCTVLLYFCRTEVALATTAPWSYPRPVTAQGRRNQMSSPWKRHLTCLQSCCERHGERRHTMLIKGQCPVLPTGIQGMVVSFLLFSQRGQLCTLRGLHTKSWV